MSAYELHQGDCLSVLRTLDAGSVQTCVTSPPYYGLRDYGTAKWEGGDPECDHKAPPAGGTGESSKLQVMQKRVDFASGIYKDICGKCGAIRIDSQIGLEESPEAYVEKLVQVFREVRRVLKDDGTFWLNLGDSYAGSSMSGGDQTKRVASGTKKLVQQYEINKAVKVALPEGMKPKDLMGIPWLVAFALRADGWYLRSDIIWHKPNPMPESVTDRPTKSHEYIFLLSKSAQYFYNAEAIKEPSVTSEGRPHGVVRDRVYEYDSKQAVLRSQRDSFKRNNSSRPDGLVPGQDKNSHRPDRADDDWDTDFRNKRSVWTVNSQPYSGAHFATFPPKLIEPCILAGSREGDVVLDPFNGSGTTGAVAIKHHRRYVGIELNPDYLTLTRKRFESIQPVLFPAQAAE